MNDIQSFPIMKPIALVPRKRQPLLRVLRSRLKAYIAKVIDEASIGPRIKGG